MVELTSQQQLNLLDLVQQIPLFSLDVNTGVISEDNMKALQRDHVEIQDIMDEEGFFWEKGALLPPNKLVPFTNANGIVLGWEPLCDAVFRGRFCEIKAQLGGNPPNEFLRKVSSQQWNFILMTRGYFGKFIQLPNRMVCINLYVPRNPVFRSR